MQAKNKPVYFNDERERELLDFARSMPSFSIWVKEGMR